MLENAAARRGVRVAFSAVPPVVRASLAEGEVKQVLYNLIRNGLQASPSGADVAVNIRKAGREILVSVQDAGDGVSPEVLPHIFDPFFSTKTSEEQAGMGLGLSVSRSLIEAMGGRIEVVPGRPGGATFTAVFPIRLEASAETSHA
jgi:signal transduction histidine kinase